jgi:hypothetical protein
MMLLFLFLINSLLWVFGKYTRDSGKIFQKTGLFDGSLFDNNKENSNLVHYRNSSHGNEGFKEEININESHVPFRAVEEIYSTLFRDLKFREKSQSIKSQAVTNKCYVNDVFQCENCCLSNNLCGTSAQCSDAR